MKWFLPVLVLTVAISCGSDPLGACSGGDGGADLDCSYQSFDGANLEGVSLWEPSFEGASLRGANLEGATLMRPNFTRADLSGANLAGASLGDGRATAYQANLSGVNLSGAAVGSADLREADLRKADLQEAELMGADLSGANLEGANLRGAILYLADMRASFLSEAVLTGAKADKWTEWPLGFDPAVAGVIFRASD